MAIKFKNQDYQTEAVKSVIDCFLGQPKSEGIKYRFDSGSTSNNPQVQSEMFGLNRDTSLPTAAYRNAEIGVDVLQNIKSVQEAGDLAISTELIQHNSPTTINLTVEMETGTGKTYVYIKTMLELNRLYGWSKFIIVVPSISIREGVNSTLISTRDHFFDAYGKKIRHFIYNSKYPEYIKDFSTDSGINVMIINQQAFNATTRQNSKEARRIYSHDIDAFNSRRPIDLISANKPILILDEPQKLEGDVKKPNQTIKALSEFKPLFAIRYSATHKVDYNKIHMLSAIDAYNKKLVKKINVRGISPMGMGGIKAHLDLRLIEVVKGANPTALLEIDKKFTTKVKRTELKVGYKDDLYIKSNKTEAYRNGFVVREINASTNTVEFSSGLIIQAGKYEGEVDNMVMRRLQIRETIRAHFQKEEKLFEKNIKVLSLFFIDSVKLYRDYEQADSKGEYAIIFEDEYSQYVENNKNRFSKSYLKYILSSTSSAAHNGYFSVDKVGNSVDSKQKGKKNEKRCDDSDAYDLILKNKEKLLSFAEPTRFIFSHSALSEGWDNPNVFVICALKHTDSETRRRQEVGRGLRICVNSEGHRQDNPETVHDINVLTIIANESYESFVNAFQKEVINDLSYRPQSADVGYFKNKILKTGDGQEIIINNKMAKEINRYLTDSEYVNDDDKITKKYTKEKQEKSLEPLPMGLKEYEKSLFALVDNVINETDLPTIENANHLVKNTLNKENFEKKEFQDLWKKIRKRAIYRVEYSDSDLVSRSIAAIDKNLNITKQQWIIRSGTQRDSVSESDLKNQDSFGGNSIDIETMKDIQISTVKYDLIGKISESAESTRKTIANILSGISKEKFSLFQENPEEFIINIIRIIKKEKSKIAIENLTYITQPNEYDDSMFTGTTIEKDQKYFDIKLKKHVFDYVDTDSKGEKEFVKSLDIDASVAVYTKLPKEFKIPTPMGDYNPDWAIAFCKNKVNHIYFVIETKGGDDNRATEDGKISCAEKFFAEIAKNSVEKVKYKMVTGYEDLRKIIT